MHYIYLSHALSIMEEISLMHLIDNCISNGLILIKYIRCGQRGVSYFKMFISKGNGLVVECKTNFQDDVVWLSLKQGISEGKGTGNGHRMSKE